MKRFAEPELMDNAEQAEAYASADFENSNSLFLELFNNKFPDFSGDGNTLDLGCGPGDIMLRFAKSFPNMIIHGVDGAEEMMTHGKKIIENDEKLNQRIKFIKGFIPGVKLPVAKYDTLISNSLLHHLHEPQYFWQAVKEYSQKDTSILIMDLRRPESKEAAKNIVNQYSATEPTVLRMDFYNSLLAAFEPDEIREQLKQEKLDYLNVEIASDRHLLIWGKIK
ncbi:MAG: class I SAM-dependent methyltransferase [Calditrichaeota bacterium]|nr:MAG: class I SAM-dependent methyltransferase [Calditrichota bacterium]MBL1205669.1 class I SAM-dependent methyltransferase [Calditrichota bacterium]NOG45497.1 class I SAM-dependent methyltransferase [Calditrichota bacterium]